MNMLIVFVSYNKLIKYFYAIKIAVNWAHNELTLVIASSQIPLFVAQVRELIKF